MRRGVRLLYSRRAAVGAVALLALLLGLAALAPDDDALGRLRERRPWLADALHRLQPAAVARSPVVLLLTGYVGLAVAVSMTTRIQARRGRGAAAARLERFVARRVVRVTATPEEVERRLRGAVMAVGLPPGDGRSGARGGAGFWGSMLFHLGLLLGLGGISASALLRFSGEAVMAEGFALEASPEVFLRANPPAGLAPLAGTRLSVSDVRADYERGTQLTDVSAVLSVERPGRPAARRFTSVNVPVEVEGLQFTVHAYGYAPELRVVDERGRSRAEGNAVLRVLPPGAKDGLDLGEGGELELRFYPDHVLTDGRHASRSLLPLAPVLTFRWVEQGREVAAGAVPLGEAVEVAGRRVEFRGLARWVDYLVGRDPGLPWFAAGAFLGILGLALRFAWYEQAWQARLTPAEGAVEVELSLSARYFPAMLEQRAARAARRLTEA